MKPNEQGHAKRESDEAQRTRVQRELDRLVDDAGYDSFPASDAPAWWSSPPKTATRSTP